MTSNESIHSWKQFAFSTLWVLLACAAFLGSLFAVGGKVVLQKGLLHLAMPAGIIWLSVLLAVVHLRSSRRSPLFACVCCCCLFLSVLGNGPFAAMLVRQLEANYIAITPETEQPFDFVVVLGGACSQGANGQVQVNSAGERVVQAARMYHGGKVKTIVCTGKRITTLAGDGLDPAEQSARTLLDLNVPSSAIQTVGGINTSQEMKNLATRFKPNQRVGLITSAWHLPRAMRLAKANGLQLHPLPGGFLLHEQQPMTLSGVMMSIIPTAEALTKSTLCVREILAGLIGR